MNPNRSIALTIVASGAIALALYGAIPQFAQYHEFADTRGLFGVPNAFDFWSNLPFLCVGMWGWRRLGKLKSHPGLANAWAGYALFLSALIATAFGSAYYHWAPDDARLVWDRLPIALACAGLLAAAFAEADRTDAFKPAVALALFAGLSVWWWARTGDLRLYLLLQALPLILVPFWQYCRRAPRMESVWFGGALLVYVAARAAEIFDAKIYAALGGVSGHTLKHLFAAAAAACIIRAVLYRLAHERNEATMETTHETK